MINTVHGWKNQWSLQPTVDAYGNVYNHGDKLDRPPEDIFVIQYTTVSSDDTGVFPDDDEEWDDDDDPSVVIPVLGVLYCDGSFSKLQFASRTDNIDLLEKNRQKLIKIWNDECMYDCVFIYNTPVIVINTKTRGLYV